MAIPESIKERYERLKKEVARHQYLYHTLDKPEISDQAYDALLRELIEIEEKYPEIKTADSPSQRIGASIQKEFKKITHKVKQWSYDNVFSFEELSKWQDKISKILKNAGEDPGKLEYVAELKINGLKVVL